MLKTDINFADRFFADRFRDKWTNDVIPNDWNNGLIVKLSKKVDLQHCDNWRGITLLSVPCKIFSSVLLNRIEGDVDVDVKMCQEQAEFRRGK